MKRHLLGIALALTAAAVAAGCGGGGIGPVKVDMPDFYVPSLSVTAKSPVRATIGSDYTISVTAADNGGTPTTKLFYRTIAVAPAQPAAYTEMAPTAVNGSTLSFTIPQAAIASPGLEYYLQASDGTHTVTVPAGAPANPFREFIRYLNISEHVEVGTVKAGTAVTIRAKIETDGTLQFGAAGAGADPITGFLYWDAATAGNPTAVVFTRETGTDYYSGQTAALPAGNWFYRIVARTLFTDATTAARTMPADGVSSLAIVADPNGPPQKPIVAITPRKADTGNAADTKFFVGERIDLIASVVNADANATYSYAWTKSAGTTLDLSEYGVSNPWIRSGIPGSFSYALKVKAVYGNGATLESDPALVTVTIETPELSVFPADLTTFVLTAAASPYTVTADYVVPAGRTLKIERGVTVRFRNETGLVVQGTLQADGDAASPIIFTAATSLPYPGYWDGISLGATPGTPLPSIPQSTISFCRIEYSRDGLTIVNANSPTISECIIQKNQNRGIFIQDTTLTVNRCQILENGDYGIVARRSAPGASPLTYATISSNIIKKNLLAGVYCEDARIELAKNEIAENRYGAHIVRCRKSEGEVVNVVGNWIHDNSDGLRVEDSDPVIDGNKINLNKDNGILAFTSRATLDAPGNAFFSEPTISNNAIHNNRDDGIQLENCYLQTVVNYPADVVAAKKNLSQIYSNVIAFNGADGIEAIGSSPVIDRCIVAHNSNTGVLCKSGYNGRNASPFLMNTNLLLNARAALGTVGDMVNGGANAPAAWWCNLYGNNLEWIDIAANPSVDLADSVGMDIGAPPFVGPIDHDNDAATPNVPGVADTRFGTGGRSYYLFTGGAAPATGTRFGWNVSTNPLFQSSAYEDPFSVAWAILSDIEDPGPRFNSGGGVVFVDGPTSGLINSGEPHLQTGAAPLITIGTSYFSTGMNSNLTLGKLLFYTWPTK